MTKPFFLYSPVSDNATITGDSGSLLDCPAENVLHHHLSIYWRSVNLIDAFIKFDMGSPVDIDTVCIAGANVGLATAGAFAITAHAADLGAAWASWDGVASVQENITFSRTGKSRHLFDATQTYRWWVIWFRNIAGLFSVDVGRVMLGEKMVLDRPYPRGSWNFSRRSISEVVKLPSGVSVGNLRQRVDVAEAELYELSSADQDKLFDLWEETDLLIPYFWDVRPEDTEFSKMVYGVNTLDFSRGLRNLDVATVNLSVWGSR
jgi:hypothetical protein